MPLPRRRFIVGRLNFDKVAAFGEVDQAVPAHAVQRWNGRAAILLRLGEIEQQFVPRECGRVPYSFLHQW